ncbi:MAG TPA: Uma2 family endonuclease [Thermoanaerobaculia bacterium]|jgi:Uma2 family endonuclease|nr:Uma2 family endonuclease [Thermoanaerobaculia bacterium]
MAVALLKEPPLSPYTDLGPYRRQDYEALPDEPRCELIFGRFYVSPSPLVLHQFVTSLFWRAFDEIARVSGGLALSAPLDVHLADHSVVQPDVLYISAAQLGIAQRWVEGAPDLLVEVLSPGTARRDRGEKLALYAESGIQEYWIVDPVERQIEFLVNEDGRFVVALPEGEEYRSRVLPEIHLNLPVFWREVEDRIGSR